MDIQLKDIVKNVPVGMDLQPSFLIHSGMDLYFVINIREPITNGVRGESSYICSYDLKKHAITWIVELTEKGKFNSILNTPVIINNFLYVVHSNVVFAIDRCNGDVVWSKKLKLKYFLGVILSNVEQRLFLNNSGELIELDPFTGKVKQSKKPRVRWFDSQVIPHRGKLYVSASNSKILELDPDNLNVLGEFKFAGGWAVGATPLFHNDSLVCASYGGSINIFDLESKVATKKFKKKAGREANQLLVNDYYIVFESLENDALTCFDVSKKKRCWKLELTGIKSVWKKDNDSIFVIHERNLNYVVDLLNIHTGKLLTTIETSPKVSEANYKFGLWDGSGGLCSESGELFLNYKPDVISIHSI